MKLKYLICNLKSYNKTYYDMVLYRDNIMTIDTKINLIVAPSIIYLPLFKDTNLNLATQNISLNQDKHLTGDISIDALKSLDVKYAIIGHFERRHYYHEKPLELLEKIKLCLNNNIKVIYCIGETKEEKERKVEYQILEKLIANILNYIDKDLFKNLIISYEPCYNIGTNNQIDINNINEIVTFIKKLIYDYYETKIDVIYGGNVNTNNINELKNIKNLDGVILGTSALNPQNIKEILTKMT